MNKHRLEIRPGNGGLSFYIDGSLQFDTRDECVYHESLVLPAASVLTARQKKPFQTLILGGGDGLALREVLKFKQAGPVDLVDYDGDVLGYAKTVFAPWNQDALLDRRVTPVVQDARDFLALSQKIYDLIVLDFTFPEDLAGSGLFTRDFYAQVKRNLSVRGLVAVNAVSPTLFPAGYWSVFKTLAAIQLYPKPFRLDIPSFAAHGYGEWGFFWASPAPIRARELRELTITVPAKYLNTEIVWQGMKFPRTQVAIASSWAKVLTEAADFLCLLNSPLRVMSGSDPVIDFSGRLTLPQWRDRDLGGQAFFAEVVAEWLARLERVARALDWETLFARIEEKLKDSSVELRKAFGQLRQDWPDLLREKIFNQERAYSLLTAFLVLMIFINMVYPDNAFAKGYYGGHYYHSHYYNSAQQSDEFLPPLFAPVAAPAFGRLLFDQHGVNVVPDMTGQGHQQKEAPFLDGRNAVRTEKLFFALSDDVFLSLPGRAYYVLPAVPYSYQVEEKRFVLFADGGTAPIFESAPDPQTLQLLRDNLAVQQKALVKTVAAYEKWLAWANPAQYVSAAVKKDVQEFENLKKLQEVLKKTEAGLGDETPASDEPTWSTRLVPGVYFSYQGSLLMKKPGGEWSAYPWRGFQPEPGIPTLEPTAAMDQFVEAVVQVCVTQRPDLELIRGILQSKMSTDK